MADKLENIHAGHRNRVRENFMKKCSLDGMSNIQILEFLLFYSIPRADTNELAHKLINAFGSLRGVFDAPISSLMNVDGVGEKTASLIKLIPSLTKVYLEENTANIKYILSTEDAVAYLRPKFASLRDEILILLCLNNNGKLLKCAEISTGSISSAEIDTRKIINEIINSKATTVILAHNHPGGICAPSKADSDMTYRLSRLLLHVHARILNHIILTDDDYFSFADNPKLSACLSPEDISPNFTVEPIYYDEYWVGEDNT